MTEDEIRPLLHAASCDIPPGVDLLARVRPARRARRVLVPVLASAGTAAAAGAVVLTAVSVGGAPSAQAQVAAAIQQTAQQSFKVHIVQDSGGTYEGASDPSRQVGWSKLVNDSLEWRYIGQTSYARRPGLPDGKLWLAEPRPTAAELAKLSAQVLLIKVAPDDPQVALERLREAKSFKASGTASGAGWTGKRYTFSIPASSDDKGGFGATTGSIAVDDQGRIRQVTFTMGGRLASPKPGNGPAKGDQSTGLKEVMEFSDFGVPVNVTAPPADQVETQSAYPRPDNPKKSKP